MNKNNFNRSYVHWIASVMIAIGAIFAGQAHTFNYPALDAAPENIHIPDIAPLFDFDTDGCFPAAGISRGGKKNPGVPLQGRPEEGCRKAFFLPYSNTLHRAHCKVRNNVTYCVNFFSLYFEKDQAATLPGGKIVGHVHDWEHVAVWTRNGIVTHGSVSAHGKLYTRPKIKTQHSNQRIKVVYHKHSLGTHALRFANEADVARPQNPYGEFVTPPIVSWNKLYGDGVDNRTMRYKLEGFNYGSATIPLLDRNFVENINGVDPKEYPEGYPKFDVLSPQECEYSRSFSEEGEAYAVCSGDRVVVGIECTDSYCDSKRLRCCNVPGANPGPGSWEAGYWISEEDPNSWHSFEAALVGLRCRGSFCDDLKLRLRTIRRGTQGEWTDPFSEEQPGYGQCGIDKYAAGLKCTGRYCDNLSLYCRNP